MTKIASTGYLPAVVVFDRESILPMQHDVQVITDSQVKSVVHCSGCLTKNNKLVYTLVIKASVYMAEYANCSCYGIQFRVGYFIWLSLEHLSLLTLLTHQLGAKFVGPYEVTKVINPVAYCLAILLTWQIYDVFHFSQLKPAIELMPGAAFDTLFQLAANPSGEFKVKDILDHCLMHSGMKYLVKWLGDLVVKATQELLSHLSNCLDVLYTYEGRSGLHPTERGW